MNMRHLFLVSALTLAGFSAPASATFTTFVSVTDTDGDGTISAEEFAAAAKAQKDTMLATYDTDGDGVLSRTERQAATLDTDKDGKTSQAERQAAHDSQKAAMLKSGYVRRI